MKTITQQINTDECIRIGLKTYLLSEIVMLEASVNYTYFYLNDGTRLVYAKTIKSFELLCLKHSFLRVHRSYIINATYLSTYSRENNYVEMCNNLKATISRRCKNRLEYYLFIKRSKHPNLRRA
ncbi:LytR/AlgR family response regulator transcription factor [Arcicella rigui]|uniref:LytR/AlgR family response regulator transcription factor n=1 Tax=Arcicella rigui TaxID=797020 RepID=UPI00389908DC